MSLYNPLSWFKKTYEEKTEVSESDKRRSKLREKVAEIGSPLERFAMGRCLQISNAKQRIHRGCYDFSELKP